MRRRRQKKRRMPSSSLIKRGTVRVQWGYSEEEEEEEVEEEEEGGGREFLKRRTELDKEKMYCGGERRWRKEIFKEKCMVGVG